MNQSFKPFIQKSTEYLSGGLDWLFPRHCFGCEKMHQPERIPNLCVFCWERIYQPQRIVFSNQPDLHIFSSGSYEDLLKRCLIQAKFKHHSISTDFVTELVQQTFLKIPMKIDLITSVPSNYWRSLWRGVDLPAMLAREISKKSGIEFRTNVLKKRRNADRQSRLNKEERKKNMIGLFEASPDIKGRNVLVVDDILTTGSTVLACFRALRRRKPSKIVFLTVAKTR